MKAGFGKNDITPRVGVELCGFGPFRNRHSIGVRDPLWARAMAIEQGGRQLVLISCDLVGVPLWITRRVRRLVGEATGVPGDAIMLQCTHTHSGPSLGVYTGWGQADAPYVETLAARIAKAAIAALNQLQAATISHAEVPCEGIGQNREYDRDALPLEEVLRDDWRPDKPELTDTTCHVIKVEAGGRMIGFLSYFGCHPVCCCQATRYIHGDFVGVATGNLEREHPGSVGLFLQGAQGDVNSCVVHKPEPESMVALDIIAARFANAVREGMGRARPMEIDALAFCRRDVCFSRKNWDLAKLRAFLREEEALVYAADATDSAGSGATSVTMATVRMLALRRMIAAAEAGQSLAPLTELQGLRVGPFTLLGSGFEVFQAIKNDVKAKARSQFPLVMGLVNDSVGYAPDRAAAARGGYAADVVPLICGMLPFAQVHDELAAALLDLEGQLY